MMHGKNVIAGDVLGVNSTKKTRGHRFHANKEIALSNAGEYAEKLKSKGFVIADIEERKQSIHDQVIKTAKKLGGIAVIDDGLLAEVTALNEWPVAVAGEFEKDYLGVPAEALIKTMQDNQKYFPVVDKNDELKNFFIVGEFAESARGAGGFGHSGRR